MAEVKWIKIVTDIFDDEKILLIESMPEADAVIVLWFKLLCLAGKNNNKGVFTLNERIPYTDEMLATIFRRNVNTVRMALKIFEQYGMIEIINGVITIPNWGKHQNLDLIDNRQEYQRQYMAKKRQEQKLLAECKPNCETTVNPIEEDIDKNKKENKNTYGNYVALTQQEYDKLTSDYGVSVLNDYIERLNDYIEQIGVKKAASKYKSHAAVIRNWYRKDNPKGGTPSGTTTGQAKQAPRFDKTKFLAPGTF